MKHFIFYYKQGTGTYIITEPRPWSRENQHHFPNYDFIGNFPTTDVIENFLMVNYGFQQQLYPTTSILYNFDPNMIW